MGLVQKVATAIATATEVVTATEVATVTATEFFFNFSFLLFIVFSPKIHRKSTVHHFRPPSPLGHLRKNTYGKFEFLSQEHRKHI